MITNAFASRGRASWLGRLGLVVAVGLVGFGDAVQAGFLQGRILLENVIIGRDDDNVDNAEIQPRVGDPNQSLNNTDILIGGIKDDVLIGRLGNDVISGRAGDDVLIGGTEQGQLPNSDVLFGDAGDDISIWAPGDGSDAFLGGRGKDALVFGVIDRDATLTPTLATDTGLPTAEVSGSPGFCTSEAGGAITFADLRFYEPSFETVSLDLVRALNRKVARIIR